MRAKIDAYVSLITEANNYIIETKLINGIFETVVSKHGSVESIVVKEYNGQSLATQMHDKWVWYCEHKSPDKIWDYRLGKMISF